MLVRLLLPQASGLEFACAGSRLDMGGTERVVTGRVLPFGARLTLIKRVLLETPSQRGELAFELAQTQRDLVKPACAGGCARGKSYVLSRALVPGAAQRAQAKAPVHRHPGFSKAIVHRGACDTFQQALEDGCGDGPGVIADLRAGRQPAGK